MPANRLSDKQLATLYYDLANHIEDCKQRNPRPSPIEIYDELWNEVTYTLYGQASQSTLKNLDESEKRKAYTVLNTIFYASPLYPERRIPGTTPPPAYNRYPDLNQPVIINVNHHYHGPRYCQNNDLMFTWLMLRSMNHTPVTHSTYAYSTNFNRPNQHGHAAYNQHGHANQNKKKTDGSVLAAVVLLCLVIAAAAAAFIAAYYLIREALNSGERFFYNEGWLQASVSLMSMAIGAVASAMLATAFATSPLTALAISAGIASPAGVAMFGVIALSIIGAAVVCSITNQVQALVIPHLNADALDPSDPHRFALTDAESDRLVAKGLDPIKVKCAIVALRAEIAEIAKEPVSSFFSRRSQAVKGSLDSIRQLRQGELLGVNAGEMNFNDFQLEQIQQQSVQQHYEPSAPPYPGY